MLVFLNGKFVPESEAMVSVFDRGFMYGDGLFETMRVCGGEPFCWEEHIERLQRGAAFLKIKIPFGADELRKNARELSERNQMPEALLRIALTRGIGGRGYSPKGANHPAIVMTLNPWPNNAPGNPQSWHVITASVRLPAGDPLAEFKSCNKLPQILARAEAEAAGADEAFLLNTDGHMVEAASSNLFWVSGKTICTPPLSSGVLAGVTRAVILDLCRELDLPTKETTVTPLELQKADGIFLSLSSWGIIEVTTLDGQAISQSPHMGALRAGYEAKIRNFRA